MRASAVDAQVWGEAVAAPRSTGTAPPRHPLPEGATDCHHHVFNPRYPPPGSDPSPRTIATVDDYRLYQRRLGLTRSVVICASAYGTDNSGLLAALAELGPAARGVAHLNADATETALDRLHAAGIRGLRVYLSPERAPDPSELSTFGAAAAARGWHLDIVGARAGARLAAWETELAALPCRLVIDHFGYPANPLDPEDASTRAVLRLVEAGRTYVKLSGVYIRSRAGYPDYEDMDPLARRLIEAGPDRMLWGSDWPHLGKEARPPPDGALLIDRLHLWAPDEALRRRILITNPGGLYWND